MGGRWGERPENDGALHGGSPPLPGREGAGGVGEGTSEYVGIVSNHSPQMVHAMDGGCSMDAEQYAYHI